MRYVRGVLQRNGENHGDYDRPKLCVQVKSVFPLQIAIALCLGLCGATASIDAQDSTPAQFTIDSSGYGSLAIPGQGTRFDVMTAGAVFNGTLDTALGLSYNTKTNGAQYNTSEPQIRQNLESNYYDGFNHYLEWNLDTVSADLSHLRRWMYLKVNRNVGSPLTGDWAFWGSHFALQTYSSPTNDVPTEYFSVNSSGIARITSTTGQPSQLYLNTSDATGYPGAYTSLVFQKASQNKWVLSNEGANGDRFSILSGQREVASFTQDGVFRSAGQRLAVVTTTASYTVAPADSVVRVDSSAGPVTITLPVASGSGQIYRIKKVDGTRNRVTIAPSGGSKINGTTTAALALPYDSMTVVDGSTGAWDKY